MQSTPNDPHISPTLGIEHGMSTDAPENTYVYGKLPPSHIRLLRLQPSLDSEAPLRFSFWTCSLDDARGVYDAISYTWGSLDLTHYITCESSETGHDAVVPITQNLFKVLQRLRHRLDIKILWADALCINQKDNDDKAQQIPIMSSIYRGARIVLAWLGGGGNEVETVLPALGRLTELPKGRAKHEDVSYIARVLPDLLALPWFMRLWIIQEVVLNIDVTLICGQSELSISKFVAALDIVRTLKCWDALKALPGAIAVINVITLREQYRSETVAVGASSAEGIED